MLVKDLFLSKITKKKIYKSSLVENLNRIKSLKPFFIHLKLKKRIPKKSIANLDPHFMCEQINFKKKFIIKNEKVTNKCRLYLKKDKKKILDICKENTSYSRFVKDIKFKKLLKYPLRYYWLENYFKKKIQNTLIVSHEAEKIKGFLLLERINKKLIINIICTSKKFKNKKVASSMIAYANNKIMKKYKINLYAGTQEYNYPALKFYKKNKFKMISKNYIYHILGK